MPSYKSKKIGSKLCLKCNQVQTLDRFYTHKEWSTQSFRDAWCKDCAAKACISKEGTREYCWYNNRRWSDTYWDMAMKKGKYALTTDADYLTARTDEKRCELEERMAGRFFFSIMNLDGVYGFSSNIDPDGAFKECLNTQLLSHQTSSVHSRLCQRQNRDGLWTLCRSSGVIRSLLG